MSGERIDQLPPGDKQPTRLTISRELPEGKTGVGFTFTFLFADGHERVVPYVLSRGAPIVRRTGGRTQFAPTGGYGA